MADPSCLFSVIIGRARGWVRPTIFSLRRYLLLLLNGRRQSYIAQGGGNMFRSMMCGNCRHKIDPVHTHRFNLTLLSFLATLRIICTPPPRTLRPLLTGCTTYTGYTCQIGAFFPNPLRRLIPLKDLYFPRTDRAAPPVPLLPPLPRSLLIKPRPPRP